MAGKSENKTILVVEDETPLLNVIRTKLSGCGFSVFMAQNVADALKILEEQRTVDAIWLDHYLLGNKSGFDLVVELKNSKNGWEKIPVFVVSNTASPEKVRSYIELGVEKYYVKAGSSLAQITDDLRKHLNVRGNCVE